MGNTLETANLNTEVNTDDAKWLLTNSDSLFNDNYLFEVSDVLSSTVSSKSNSKSAEMPRFVRSYNISSKAVHLSEIYSKVGSEVRVADGLFETITESSDILSFQNVVDCRSRLLNRINLVSKISLVRLFI